MGPFCQFFRETVCNENCSIDYHNTPCACSFGSIFDETVCETSIQCNDNSSCSIETAKNCSRNIYSFNINDFCDIQSDIIDVQCEHAGNLHFKLLLDKKRRLCTSALNKSTALANCECKTCSGQSCRSTVATYCSCISPHKNQPETSTSISNSQTDTESSGSSALIGGVVGGILVVAIVIILVLLWYRRKKSVKRAGNRVSKAHENKAYEEGAAKFQRGTGSVRVYEEVSDTLNREKQNNELKPGNTSALGGYDSVFSPKTSSRPEKDWMSVNGESDYNQLDEERATNRNNGGSEQYDHVKDIRGLPENTEDYDHLNNFSKTSYNDTNDEYDHCKAVLPRQRGKIVETPDDDYDHFV